MNVFNEHGQMEPSYTPDMAAGIDSPAQLLADTFGIPIGPAIRIAQWHHREMEMESMQVAASTFAKAIAYLLQPSKNLVAKVWGIAFSCGLATRINGVRNISHKARELRVHRALLSHYKREADAKFKYEITIFGKSREACAKYRESRIRYLMNQENRKA